MGTYKRPLADGEICQDSRVAYNPFLGQGTAKAEASAVSEAPVAPKAQKKAKEAEVPVEPEAEAAPVEAAE